MKLYRSQGINHIITICILLVTVASANAVVFTYDGGEASANWTVAGNWNGDVLPTFNNQADIVIDSTEANSQVAGANKTIRSLSFVANANNQIRLNNSGNNNGQARNLIFSADSGNSTLTIGTGVTGDKVIRYDLNASASTNPGFVQLDSNLDIVHDGTGTLTLGSAINAGNGHDGSFVSGVGSITKTGSGTLIFAGKNTYTGSTAVNAGQLDIADGAGMTLVIGATGVNNDITGTGILNIDGSFNFDLTGAGTTVGNSWQIVDVGNLTETFGGTFIAESTLGSFTEISNVWSISENGAIYEFSEATGVLQVVAVPEPSTCALLGLGFAALHLLRRKPAV